MTEKDDYRYVFGPVPSRRLGRSLGVDLVPFKTCSLDCIYCQLGRTTCRTIERADYVPHAEVIDEVRRKLADGAAPDHVTLAGSGEPTLHLHLAEVIAGIKQLTSAPVTILTNGSLLYDEAVRAACRQADIVIPSLDAGDEAVFQQINRPHPSLDFSAIIDGLVAFRAEHPGKLWLEVFLVEGLNATEGEVLKIKQLAERIKPDRIQLNTAVRPTAEQHALRVSEEPLLRLCKLFGPSAEVIADFRKVHDRPEYQAKQEDVLAMLKRRPCSADDVSAGLSIHRNEALKFLGELERSGQIVSERRNDLTYYSASPR